MRLGFLGQAELQARRGLHVVPLAKPVALLSAKIGRESASSPDPEAEAHKEPCLPVSSSRPVLCGVWGGAGCGVRAALGSQTARAEQVPHVGPQLLGFVQNPWLEPPRGPQEPLSPSHQQGLTEVGAGADWCPVPLCSQGAKALAVSTWVGIHDGNRPPSTSGQKETTDGSAGSPPHRAVGGPWVWGLLFSHLPPVSPLSTWGVPWHQVRAIRS